MDRYGQFPAHRKAFLAKKEAVISFAQLLFKQYVEECPDTNLQEQVEVINEDIEALSCFDNVAQLLWTLSLLIEESYACQSFGMRVLRPSRFAGILEKVRSKVFEEFNSEESFFEAVETVLNRVADQVIPNASKQVLSAEKALSNAQFFQALDGKTEIVDVCTQTVIASEQNLDRKQEAYRKLHYLHNTRGEQACQVQCSVS